MNLINYTKQFSGIETLLKRSKSLITGPKSTLGELAINGLINIISVRDFITATGIKKYKITYKLGDKIQVKTVLAKNKVDALHKFKRSKCNAKFMDIN